MEIGFPNATGSRRSSTSRASCQLPVALHAPSLFPNFIGRCCGQYTKYIYRRRTKFTYSVHTCAASTKARATIYNSQTDSYFDFLQIQTKNKKASTNLNLPFLYTQRFSNIKFFNNDFQILTDASIIPP